jgi:hypothetical protein
MVAPLVKVGMLRDAWVNSTATSGIYYNIGPVSASPNINETAGDAAEMIMFSRSNCTRSAPYVIDGSKPKRTVDAGIGDTTGSTARVHGYSMIVMDNDDSTIFRYEGTMQMKKDASGTTREPGYTFAGPGSSVGSKAVVRSRGRRCRRPSRMGRRHR